MDFDFDFKLELIANSTITWKLLERKDRWVVTAKKYTNLDLHQKREYKWP